MVTGLYSAAIRSALQPAGCAGWIELLRYSLMPLGDFARRRSPSSHRSSMALPPVPPCRDHSVTESALSGCLSASRPHTHGSFRRWRIRSHYARFDARSSIKPSVLATLGGIDVDSPMAHSSTTFILARRLRLQGTSQPRLHAANMVVLKGKRASIGKADLAGRTTMDMSDHYARDTVGIYKPPNITWWPWAILAALALVLTGKYLLRK